MITGRIIADGVDLKSTYGAYVVEGGYVDIPCFPEIKQPEMNDWYEYNGIEIDLSSPHFKSHEISLSMKMNGSDNDIFSFLTFMRSARTRLFEFVDISRTRRMRVDSIATRHHSLGLIGIDVILCDDAPRKDIVQEQLPPYYFTTGLEMDGVDLSAYGVRLTGSVDGLYPGTVIKENVLSDTIHIDGDIHYDGDMAVTFDRQDISVRCVVRSNSIASFWKKRDALMLALTKEGERVLSYKGDMARAYYKDCRSIYFGYYNVVWWEFELTFGYIGEVNDDDNL